MGKKKSKSLGKNRRRFPKCLCGNNDDDNGSIEESYKPTKKEEIAGVERQQHRTPTPHVATSDNQLGSMLSHLNEDEFDGGMNEADDRRHFIGEPLDTNSHSFRNNQTKNERYEVENSFRVVGNDRSDHVVDKIEKDYVIDDIPFIDDDDVEMLYGIKQDPSPVHKVIKQAASDTQKTIGSDPNNVTRNLESDNKEAVQNIAASIKRETDTKENDEPIQSDSVGKREENIDQGVPCLTNVDDENDTSEHDNYIDTTEIGKEIIADTKFNLEETIVLTQYMDTSMNVIDSHKVNVISDDASQKSSVGDISDDSNNYAGNLLTYQKLSNANDKNSAFWNDPEMKTHDSCLNHIVSEQIQSNGTNLDDGNTANIDDNVSENKFITVEVDENEENKAICLNRKDDSNGISEITDSLNDGFTQNSFDENRGQIVNDPKEESLEYASSYENMRNDLDAPDTDDIVSHVHVLGLEDKEALVDVSDSEVERQEGDASDSNVEGQRIDSSGSEVMEQVNASYSEVMGQLVDASWSEVNGPQVDTSFSEVNEPQVDPSGSEVKDQQGNTEKPLPEFSDNILFYQNKIYSRPAIGHKVEDMHGWKGDYNQLERNHSYIQWLFPIPGSCGMNHQAQPLQEHEAEEFRKSDKLKARVQKSFEMMLDFYGMKLVDGYVQRNETNWEARYDHLNKSFHNRMRITRIIQSIGELGFEQLQSRWLSFLMVEAMVDRSLHRLGGDSMQYFIDAIKEDDERQKFYEKYFRYVQGDFSDVYENSNMETDQTTTTNLEGDGSSIADGYITADEKEMEDAVDYLSANEGVDSVEMSPTYQCQNRTEPDSTATDYYWDTGENDVLIVTDEQENLGSHRSSNAKMLDEKTSGYENSVNSDTTGNDNSVTADTSGNGNSGNIGATGKENSGNVDTACNGNSRNEGATGNNNSVNVDTDGNENSGNINTAVNSRNVDTAGNENSGNVDTAGNENSGNIDTAGNENSGNISSNENSGNVDTDSNENSGNVDTAGNENSGNIDTTDHEKSGNIDTAGNENSWNVDTAGNENSGNVDTAGNENNDIVDATDNENSGNIDTAGNENSGNIDTAGNENSGNIDTAGNENSGKIDTAGNENNDIVDATDNENSGKIDTAGNENSGNIDTAGNENSDIVDTSGNENSENVNTAGNENSGNVDTTGNENRVNTDTSGNKNSVNTDTSGNKNSVNTDTCTSVNEKSVNADTSVNENSVNADTSGNANSGNIGTTGKENSGNVDTAGNEISGNVDTACNENSGNVNTTGNENSRNVDKAHNGNSGNEGATGNENSFNADASGNANNGNVCTAGNENSENVDKTGKENSGNI